MTDRITEQDLTDIEQFVNEELGSMKAKYKIVIGGRYGYKAIDVYTLDGKMANCYESGLTKRECYNMLRFLRRNLYCLVEGKVL
jgi:hypothetical protein